MTASVTDSVGVPANRRVQSIASPLHPFAALSWDGGKELRIYHLGPGNILQDYGYSANGKNNGWFQGQLHKLGIALRPDSGLAAIRLSNDNIRIYYQVPESGIIQGLCTRASMNSAWVKGRIIAKAVNGSSIAATIYSHSNQQGACVYYQDLDLHLREKVWSPGASEWASGSFDAGAQPHGTPISATTTDDDTHIHVSWTDAKGRIIRRKQPKSLGCGANAKDYRSEHLDGRG